MRIMRFTFIFLLIILTLLVVGFFLYPNIMALNIKTPEVVIASVKIGDINISVELADTPEKRARGLSGKKELEENGGMLFINNEPDFYSFWMKDMEFSIDIIWIDEKLAIIDITENVQPDSFPQTFQPIRPAKYILEINSGWADRNNIEIGNKMWFSF